MPSTNGSGPKTAILYVRVSTDEQARHGYSIRQQLERGREWCIENGYKALKEIVDAGQSGASLERPGMDEVRDLVALGGVHVVWAQDRDRLSREPAYSYLLRREFEEHGTRLRSDNDRGDESPEGELTDGILDQLAKYERAKIAERSRRGRLRKAREGKLLRNGRAHYGFKHDDTGNGYVVDPVEMPVVWRIFELVGGGETLYGVKRTLERESVPPPSNGSKGGEYWGASYLRTVIKDDVYRPHTYLEIAELVAPEVADRLDDSGYYGICWFNRTRTTRKRVRKPGAEGLEYKWSYTVRNNPRDQWVAIPIPNADIPRHLVDQARAMLQHNRKPSSTGRRFWQLPAGTVRCGQCGTSMLQYASAAGGRIYAYYKCSRLVRMGKDACSPNRVRTNHRAEEVEAKVWDLVSRLLKDPERLRSGLDEMIERERSGMRGDPEQEAKVWLQKLSEVDQERRGYLRIAAKGHLEDAELDEALAELEETRLTAERELASLRSRTETIEALERDRDALLDRYTEELPEAIDALSPEECHRVYKLLGVGVRIRPDTSIEVSGVIREDALFSNSELVPRYRA